MNFKQLKNLVRSGGTARFHCYAAETIKTQDVAQHSFGVFWICEALTFGSPSAALLIQAMAHDIGERWVGDVPATTKRSIPGLGSALTQLEDEAMLKKIGHIVTCAPLSDSDAVVLKAADALDGALFCLRELEFGNRAMAGVFRNFIEFVQEQKDRAEAVCRPAEFNFELLHEALLALTKEAMKHERE